MNMNLKRRIGVLAISLAVLLVVFPAQAAFAQQPSPWGNVGGTEKIVFAADRDGDWDIYIMNADGTGVTNLTNSWTGPDTSAKSVEWHPSLNVAGTKIVFASNGNPLATNPTGDHEIFAMNTDGTGVEQITSNAVFDGHPFWRPDGTAIVFSRNVGGTSQVFRVDYPGGAGQIAVTTSGGGHPTYSPNNALGAGTGYKIVFGSDRLTGGGPDWEIYYVDDAAGEGGLTQVTTNTVLDAMPSWSPDGTRIAFHSDRGPGAFPLPSMGVYTINPVGIKVEALVIDESRFDGQPYYKYNDSGRLVYVREGKDTPVPPGGSLTGSNKDITTIRVNGTEQNVLTFFNDGREYADVFVPPEVLLVSSWNLPPATDEEPANNSCELKVRPEENHPPRDPLVPTGVNTMMLAFLGFVAMAVGSIMLFWQRRRISGILA